MGVGDSLQAPFSLLTGIKDWEPKVGLLVRMEWFLHTHQMLQISEKISKQIYKKAARDVTNMM